MNKYNKIGFVNGSAPALNADNLNHMDEGIERATDGAIALETEIATARGDSADLNTRFISGEASIEVVKSEIATARGSYDNLDQRLNDLIVDDEGVITTFNLADGAVTTASIEDGAVTQNKLSADLKSAVNSIANKADTADVDTALATKADKATTLAGYGITDAYTQSEIKVKLDQKLKKMPFDSEPKQESPCYLTSGTVYNALFVKANKASTLAGYGITDAYTKNAVDASLANKADKATTLDGYGITDTYTRSEIKIRLEEKLKKMPFDSEPTLNSPCYLTSGAVYNALLSKYDSSNIESGTSTLTPYSTVADKIKSASCTYKTIGDVVIVSATVKMNAVSLAGNSMCPLIDLPYKCISEDNVFCVGISNLGKLFKFAIPKNNTWLQFSTQDKTAYTFADGEQINVICLYKIK